MIRKVLTVLVVFMFLFAGAANATVYNWGQTDLFKQLKAAFGTTSDGHSHDGTNSRSLGTSTENPTFATNVVAAGFKEGVTVNVSSESSLTSAALAYGYITKVTSDHPAILDNTVGLANGVPGQMITITMTTLTQSWIIHAAYITGGTTTTGWTTLTFDTSGDLITLLFLDTTNGWIVVYNSGVTIA